MGRKAGLPRKMLHTNCKQQITKGPRPSKQNGASLDPAAWFRTPPDGYPQSNVRTRRMRATKLAAFDLIVANLQAADSTMLAELLVWSEYVAGEEADDKKEASKEEKDDDKGGDDKKEDEKDRKEEEKLEDKKGKKSEEEKDDDKSGDDKKEDEKDKKKEEKLEDEKEDGDKKSKEEADDKKGKKETPKEEKDDKEAKKDEEVQEDYVPALRAPPPPPPGDINTEPDTKLVFNAPYDDKHTYHIKIINSSARRIGWAIKTTNAKRLGVDPGSGVLDPKEAILLSVSCDAFAYGQEDTNNDRITIEWTNTPEGAGKQFSLEWFRGDGMVSRKNLPIEYNP